MKRTFFISREMVKTDSKVKISALLLCLMLIGALVAACGGGREAESDHTVSASTAEDDASTVLPEPAVRAVTDGSGKTVEIPHQVSSIAASGALNQIVLMLGGGDRLVATAEGVQKGFFTVVYPRIKEIPAAYTGSGPGTLNMETLLQAQPQVVFGSFNEKDAETLETAGIAMLGLSLNDPEDIKNTIALVGKVLGPEGEKKAVQFSSYYDENLKYVSDITKSAKKVRVFIAAGDGASGPVATTPGKDIHTSYIEAAGGVNIAAEKFPVAPAGGSATVDFEFLIGEQPDVIVAQSRAVYDYITDEGNGSQWQKLNAVKEKRVYLTPKGVYLWSVRSAEGALQPLWLAKVLHPDLLKELSLEQSVKEFYKEYYYYDLSDSETEGILNPK